MSALSKLENLPKVKLTRKTMGMAASLSGILSSLITLIDVQVQEKRGDTTKLAHTARNAAIGFAMLNLANFITIYRLPENEDSSENGNR